MKSTLITALYWNGINLNNQSHFVTLTHNKSGPCTMELAANCTHKNVSPCKEVNYTAQGTVYCAYINVEC